MVGIPKRLSHGDEVPLTDHLDELRNRLFVSLGVLAVAWSIAFWRHQDILDLLIQPLPEIDHKKILPTTLSPLEPFTTALTVSLWAGIGLALPVIFYQVFAFVIPAFSEYSAKRLWPLLFFVPALFTVGAAFSYKIILPPAAQFLLGFDEGRYNVQVRAKEWYQFAAFSMFAVGLMFEMPIAAMMLARLRIINSRLMIRQWRISIFMLVIVAVLLPTVDPFSLMLETIPLLGLYGISIVLVKLVEPKAGEQTDDEPSPAL